MTEELPSYLKAVDLYILDWDGTCIFTHSKVSAQLLEEPQLLPGVKEFFDYASSQGSVIVILTGRAESARETTLAQIQKLGLWCSYLLCTGSNGRRILVNDTKPNSNLPTAIGLTVERNVGLEDILTRLSDIDEAYKNLEDMRNKQQGN